MTKAEQDPDLLAALVAVEMDLLTVEEAAGLLRHARSVMQGSLRRIAIETNQLSRADVKRIEAALAVRVKMADGNMQSVFDSLVDGDGRRLYGLSRECTLRNLANGVAEANSPACSGRDSGPGGDSQGPIPGAPADSVDGESLSPTGPIAIDVNDDLSFVRTVAQGGLGEVFVVRDRRLKREVALKRIRPELADDPEKVSRFLVEAEITGALEHPGVVPIYELGHDRNGQLFYLMRMIEGESYKKRISAHHRSAVGEERRLGFRQLLYHFVRICEVVAYAHSRGILHRDLKPSNVMIGKYGETLVVDWGLAKSLAVASEHRRGTATGNPCVRSGPSSSLHVTVDGTALGTPHYMSPEQARGEVDKVGPASDIYSLGATLYHVLTGQPPLFDQTETNDILHKAAEGKFQPPRALDRRIPPVLERICLKAMAYDPARRYASASELAADVEHYLANERAPGVPESLDERLERWSRRHRPLVRLSCVSLALISLIAVTAVVLVSASRDRAEARRLEALDQSRIASARKTEMERLSTRLLMDRGLDLLERGERRAGLLWLARSLMAAAPQGDPLENCIRSNIAAWETQIAGLRTTLEHGSPTRLTALSPDGETLAIATEDGRVILRDLASLAQLGDPISHDGPVRALAFSRSSELLATGGEDQTVKIWDRKTQHLRGSVRLGHGGIRGLGFTTTGASLVAACADGTCLRVNPFSVQTERGSVNLGAPVRALAVSPTGSWAAAAGEQGKLLIWNWQKEVVIRPGGLEGAVLCLAQSPDGKLLAAAGDDRYPLLFNADNGDLVAANANARHASAIQALAFSPDGSQLATGSYDSTSRIWAVPSLEVVAGNLRQGGQVWDVAFAPGGDQLAVAVDDNTVQLWSTRGYRRLQDPLPHLGPVRKALFSRDGDSLITASDDGVVRIWTLNRAPGLGLPMKHTRAIQAIAARPDGKALATVSTDGELWLWDALTTRLIARRTAHPKHEPTELLFDPSGTLLACSARDGSVRQFDAHTLEPVGKPIQMPSWVRRIAIAPDGTLAAGDHLGRLGLWSLRTGEPRSRIIELPHTITALAYNPTGTRLAVGDSSGMLRIWDAIRLEPIGQPMRHAAAVRSVRFSPDGNRIATASEDKTARIWSPLTQQPLTAPLPHRAYVWTVRFNPSGDRLLTACFDGFARLWDGQSGASIGEWLRQDDLVYAAIFNEDGTRITTHGRNRLARLWDVAASRPVGPPLEHADEIQGLVFIPGQPLVATASRDTTARLWPLPLPTTEPAAVVSLRLEVKTGLQLEPNGTIQVLEPLEWHRRSQALEARSAQARDSAAAP